MWNGLRWLSLSLFFPLVSSCRTSDPVDAKTKLEKPVENVSVELKTCALIVSDEQARDRIVGVGYGSSRRESDEQALEDARRQASIVLASVSRGAAMGRRDREDSTGLSSVDPLFGSARIVDRCRGDSMTRASVAVVDKRELGKQYERHAVQLLQGYLKANPGDFSEVEYDALTRSSAEEHRLWRAWQTDRSRIAEELALCRYLSGCSEEYRNDLSVVDNWMRSVPSKVYHLVLTSGSGVFPPCLVSSLLSRSRQAGFTFALAEPTVVAGKGSARCRVDGGESTSKSSESVVTIDCEFVVSHKVGTSFFRIRSTGTGGDRTAAETNACATLEMREE
jgi:hypothetical protein